MKSFDHITWIDSKDTMLPIQEKIHAVILNGIYLDRKKLDKVLADVKILMSTK